LDLKYGRIKEIEEKTNKRKEKKKENKKELPCASRPRPDSLPYHLSL
jgi:hypothetical protein